MPRRRPLRRSEAGDATERLRSAPRARPRTGAEFTRAELGFYGVDHSGASHTAEIFFDNPGADINTPRDPSSGYAGWFTVFGHGGCFGAERHCDVHGRHVDAFDIRPPHPLTPLTIAVTVTTRSTVFESRGWSSASSRWSQERRGAAVRRPPVRVPAPDHVRRVRDSGPLGAHRWRARWSPIRCTISEGCRQRM